jgi:tetrahydromethanopterin S-methyltransferase subunit B
VFFLRQETSGSLGEQMTGIIIFLMVWALLALFGWAIVAGGTR